MNKFFLLSLYTSVMVTAFGQSLQKQAEHIQHSFDLASSVAKGEFATALSWNRKHGVTRHHKLLIGYGVRATAFIAANKFYTTAPARYTSPVQSLATIFSETIEANIDTLTTPTGWTNSINAVLYIEYSLTRTFDIGFNIDVAGISFGPSKTFNIISSSFDPNQQPVQSGKPTSLNLLLTSDNDIGSLNSEFYLRYWLSPSIGLRTGFTFLFSEYRTERKLSFNNGEIMNDRYRLKSGMYMLAATFKPFK